MESSASPELGPSKPLQNKIIPAVITVFLLSSLNVKWDIEHLKCPAGTHSGPGQWPKGWPWLTHGKKLYGSRTVARIYLPFLCC